MGGARLGCGATEGMDFCKLCNEQVLAVRSPEGDLVCDCGWVLATGCSSQPIQHENEHPHNYEVSTRITRDGKRKRGNVGGHDGDLAGRLNKAQKRLTVKTAMRMTPETHFDMHQRNLDTLHLPAPVLQTAVEVYDLVLLHEKPRGVNRKALLPLALYLACKADGSPGVARKVDDFSSAFGVRRKDVLNMEKRALPLLTDRPYFVHLSRPVDSGDELGRIVSTLCLGLDWDARQTKSLRKHAVCLNDVVRKAGRLDGRAPMSVVAGVLRVVAAKCAMDIPKRRLEEVCGVQTNTITQLAALIAREPDARLYLERLTS